MVLSIQLTLSALLLSAVHASLQDNGPQTFGHPQQQPQPQPQPQQQYAQRYKEVIMYLTPTQIRNYEAGHGLPNVPQPSPENYEQQILPHASPPLTYEQERSPQPLSYTYVREQIPQAAPAYVYEQQKPEPQIPINQEEGEIIQSTLDILEANKMQFHQAQAQHNNPNIEITRAQVNENSDIRPIVEPNTEDEEATKIQVLRKQQQQQQEQNKLIEQANQQQQEQNKFIEQTNQQQEQIAKSYAFIRFFSNQKPESPQKIQIFHPEPHSINLNEELRLQNANNIEIQRDPLLRQKYKLIPYEYIAEQNIHQKVRDDLIKQGQIQVQNQLFVPSPEHLQSTKDKLNQQRQYQQQYAPQFTIPINNIDLGKILQQSQLEREAAKIHADNIAKSPPIVIHNDISIIKRRPIQVTKHVNVPYPAPFFVPVSSPVEVKIPQPYAVPIEIIRHVPVPIVKTETVEVAKPVPYEVEKHVAEFVEKKVYVPVDKPYTVERIVPVEVKKEIPVEVPVHKPEKFTVIRHVWKH